MSSQKQEEGTYINSIDGEGTTFCGDSAGTVVIGGVLKGSVYAGDKVVIRSTGMMIGEIHTSRLIAEEGVVLNGSCSVRITPEKEHHSLKPDHCRIRLPDPSCIFR